MYIIEIGTRITFKKMNQVVSSRFNYQYSHHIETSQLICSGNQMTCFYMMQTLVIKAFLYDANIGR